MEEVALRATAQANQVHGTVQLMQRACHVGSLASGPLGDHRGGVGGTWLQARHLVGDVPGRVQANRQDPGVRVGHQVFRRCDVAHRREYERLRGVVFQVDAWLPEGSRFLRVYVRIQNPTTDDVPMYWWSNAAVPEGPGVRVIAPAASAWHFGYERYLAEVPMPDHGGSDVSYTTRAAHPADYFFRVRANAQPWVAAVNEDGRGVLQTSTDRLIGRKLFRWGTGPSGRTWQNWLGDSRDPYLEIQAGLAETQLEHLRLPAGQDWDWVEAYGPVSTDPEQAHGPWLTAQEAIAQVVARAMPAAELQADLEVARGRADEPPARVLGTASGWGALEQRRRRQADEPLIPDTGTPFPAHTLGPEQEPWLDRGSHVVGLCPVVPMFHSTPPANQALRSARLAKQPANAKKFIEFFLNKERLAGISTTALNLTPRSDIEVPAQLADLKKQVADAGTNVFKSDDGVNAKYPSSPPSPTTPRSRNCSLADSAPLTSSRP